MVLLYDRSCASRSFVFQSAGGVAGVSWCVRVLLSCMRCAGELSSKGGLKHDCKMSRSVHVERILRDQLVARSLHEGAKGVKGKEPKAAQERIKAVPRAHTEAGGNRWPQRWERETGRDSEIEMTGRVETSALQKG